MTRLLSLLRLVPASKRLLVASVGVVIAIVLHYTGFLTADDVLQMCNTLGGVR